MYPAITLVSIGWRWCWRLVDIVEKAKLVSIGWRVVCCRVWCDELLRRPEFCDHGFDAVFVGPGALGHGLASETGGG